MAELKIVHDSWELNKLFRISRSSKKTAETLKVQISKYGKTGSGEGVPYSHYNETIDSVSLQIEDLRSGIENDEINLNNLNISDYFNFLNKIGFIPQEICEIHYFHKFLVQIDILFIKKDFLDQVNKSEIEKIFK